MMLANWRHRPLYGALNMERVENVRGMNAADGKLREGQCL
jgi:hypothetical protein